MIYKLCILRNLHSFWGQTGSLSVEPPYPTTQPIPLAQNCEPEEQVGMATLVSGFTASALPQPKPLIAAPSWAMVSCSPVTLVAIPWNPTSLHYINGCPNVGPTWMLALTILDAGISLGPLLHQSQISPPCFLLQLLPKDND